jgi:hypothetical protein
MDELWTKSPKLTAVECRFSILGCRGEAVGIFHVPLGCVCWVDPVQALCAQHLEKAQSQGPITCLYDWRKKRVK